MGDHTRVYPLYIPLPSRYLTKQPRPTQPGHPFVGMSTSDGYGYTAREDKKAELAKITARWALYIISSALKIFGSR